MNALTIYLPEYISVAQAKALLSFIEDSVWWLGSFDDIFAFRDYNSEDGYLRFDYEDSILTFKPIPDPSGCVGPLLRTSLFFEKCVSAPLITLELFRNFVCQIS